MESSVKIKLGQIEPVIKVVTPLELYLLSEYSKGSIYLIEEKETAFFAKSKTEIIKLWGDGEEFTPFTIRIDAQDSEMTIPAKGEGHLFDIDWGDGNINKGVDAEITHQYNEPGEYIIKIFGKFPYVKFYQSGVESKVVELIDWGDVEWENMDHSFFDCKNMACVSESTAKTRKVKNFLNCFRNCRTVKNILIEVSHAAENISGICYDCRELKRVNTEEWNTSNITTMSQAFFRCMELETIDVSEWNTSELEDMGYLFKSCTKIQSLDLRSWDTSNVRRLEEAFSYMSAIPEIDLTNFITENVDNMRDVFRSNNLKVRGASSWNVEKVDRFGEYFMTSGRMEDYDDVLCNWSQQNLQPNLSINFGNSQYTDIGESCRNDIINNFGWTIQDGGHE